MCPILMWHAISTVSRSELALLGTLLSGAALGAHATRAYDAALGELVARTPALSSLRLDGAGAGGDGGDGS